MKACSHAVRRRATAAVAVALILGTLAIAPRRAAASETLDQQQHYVQALYRDLLHRDGDEAGVAHWTARLQRGDPRDRVVADFVATPEFSRAVVRAYYPWILQREAEDAGVAAWSTWLQSGGRYDDFRATLLASSEFFRKHGATHTAWVTAVYDQALGRAVDPAGLAYWHARLNAGATRFDVADAIVQTTEGHRAFVRFLYTVAVNRMPSDDELVSFAEALEAGADDTTAVIGVYSLDEYFDQAQPTPVTAITPAWSPDGKTVAFVSERDGAHTIYLADPEGTDVRRLVGDQLAFATDPAWSPDGTRLAFWGQGAHDTDIEIWVVDADGTDLHAVTSAIGDESMPAWSPDGKRLAYMAGVESADLFTMAADGTDIRQVTATPDLFEANPAWLPDGRIVFDRAGGKVAPDVYVMNADGTNVVRLTDAPRYDGAPAVSHDGSMIAFTSDRDGPRALWVMQAVGSGEREVTDSEVFSSSDWSPDGRWIAFDSIVDHAFHIVVVAPDGADEHVLF
jgi:TolB protein